MGSAKHSQLEARLKGVKGLDAVGTYEVVPFLPERNATLDTLRWAKKRHQIPILLEVDVTRARERIREYRRRTGVGLSLTGWVVSCVARAAAEHPRVHSIRSGRRKLVLVSEVDVAVVLERAVAAERGNETLPMPFVIRNAEKKTAAEVHEEIRSAQESEVAPGTSSIERGVAPWLQSLFFRSPAWLRDLVFWRWFLRNPVRIKEAMGTVVVTAVGMMAPGVLAWGVPLSLHPLAVSVGGITQRHTLTGKQDVLALTVVFDHAVTDGAPVGRFIRRLNELMKAAEGLDSQRGPEGQEAGES
jgi:pyruvate/2-oxoglutarate dehydrogenase complex dihydrolipoamide acyltransferase (E2) component